MKRYWLFAGTDMPLGGMSDFQLGGQQAKMLIDWLNNNLTNEELRGIPFTWFEVVDVNTQVVKVRGRRSFTAESIDKKGVDLYTFNEGKGKWMKLKATRSSS